MISVDGLVPIGFVSKTHGIKGELNVALETDYLPEDFRFLFFDIDGCYIPFAVESSRGNSETNRLVSLKGVDSVEEARAFAGKTVYVDKAALMQHPLYAEEAADTNLYLSDLVGYHITDSDDRSVGKVTGFNDDTQNYLLEVETNQGANVFIPFVDEWIIDLDTENKTLKLNLPEGLIE